MMSCDVILLGSMISASIANEHMVIVCVEMDSDKLTHSMQ